MTQQAGGPPNPVDPGTRIPNIMTKTAEGARFDYYRDLTRSPTLFLAADRADRLAADALPATDALNLVVLGDGRLRPGARVLADPDGSIRGWILKGGAYGALLADANQRVVSSWRDPAPIGPWLTEALAGCRRDPPVEHRQTAPVLILPRVVTADLRQRLIDALEDEWREGMVSVRVGDETRLAPAPDRKKRRDRTIKRDDAFYAEIRQVIAERLAPELWKAWWVEKVRSEAYYLGCYEADRSDFFAAHRDNNLPGTAHRRFAISIELNDDYDGGGVVFPEYSDDRWRAPAGGALVFSCALMHEAVPVSRGRRYVLLAFLAEG